MDFSRLTNDQLVELVRALCYEAAQRGWATQQAAQAAMLSEAEKARIAADAAAREAERLHEAEKARIAADAAARVRREAEAAMSQAEAARRLTRDQRRAALAEAVYEVVGADYLVNLWSPKDRPGTDRRVYFNPLGRAEKICVHIDGSSRTRPETVEGAKGHKATAILAIAKIALAQGLDAVSTKVYRERDDLERGGSYRAKYEPILAETAKIEQEQAERRAAYEAAQKAKAASHA